MPEPVGLNPTNPAYVSQSQQSTYSLVIEKIKKIVYNILNYIGLKLGIISPPLTKDQEKKIEYLQQKEMLEDKPTKGLLHQDTQELSKALTNVLQLTCDEAMKDKEGEDSPVHKLVKGFEEFLENNASEAAKFSANVVADTISSMLVFSDDTEIKDQLLLDWLTDVYYLTTDIDPDKRLPRDLLAIYHKFAGSSAIAFNELPKMLKDVIADHVVENKRNEVASALMPKLEVKRLLVLMNNDKKSVKNLLTSFMAASLQVKIEKHSESSRLKIDDLLKKITVPEGEGEESNLSQVVKTIIPKVTDRISLMVQNTKWSEMIDGVVRQTWNHIDHVDTAEANKEANKKIIERVKKKLLKEGITEEERNGLLKEAIKLNIWPDLTLKNIAKHEGSRTEAIDEIINSKEMKEAEKEALNLAYLGDFLAFEPKEKRHFISDCLDPMLRKLFSREFLKNLIVELKDEPAFVKLTENLPLTNNLNNNESLDQLVKFLHLYLYSIIKSEMEKKLSFEALQKQLSKESVQEIVGETVLLNVIDEVKEVHLASLVDAQKEEIAEILLLDNSTQSSEITSRTQALVDIVETNYKEYAKRFKWSASLARSPKEIVDERIAVFRRIRDALNLQNPTKETMLALIEQSLKQNPSFKEGLYGKLVNRLVFNLGEFSKVLKPFGVIWERALGSYASSAIYPYRTDRHVAVKVITKTINEQLGTPDKVRTLLNESPDRPVNKEIKKKRARVTKVRYDTRVGELSKIIYSLIISQAENQILGSVLRETLKLFIGDERGVKKLIHKVVKKGFMRNEVANIAYLNSTVDVIATHLTKGLAEADKAAAGGKR